MTRLTWGMIGGGEGSQIGPVHRISSAMDGRFDLRAGALDVDAAKGKDFARRLGIEPGRAYGNWQDMLAGEKGKSDRLDLVTVATPNSTHYTITKAFLEAGINVLCEKPMTVTVQEAEDIVVTARRTKTICAVNYGYTGYALVRHMRAMVARGDLGKVRLVVVEFSHGFHADQSDAENPRMRWRYDPAQAGISGQFADCGIHALNMASFITGQNARELSADFVSAIASRQLEDDAMVNVRMDGGTTVRLWSSSVAVGSFHGLNIRVFGEKGGLRWAQQWPDQLFWTPLNGRTETIERGSGGLSPDAERATRIAAGHSEGMLVAFANIYNDLADAIQAHKAGADVPALARHFPTAVDGCRSIAAIRAAVDSATENGRWVDARPPSLRG
jgi:predicted dehydrogenase